MGLGRRSFLGLSGLTAAALGTGTWRPASPAMAGDEQPRQPPNIVFMQADDLGFGELGSYGQQRILTPRLDRLAEEGIRFTDCYAGGPVCAPSRCVLLTGRHGGHCTVRENPAGDLTKASLRSDDVTFAEALGALGYRTACFGKWGFGPEQAGQPSHPNERGFDEFFGYITHTHAHDYYPTYLFENGDRVNFPENEGADATYAPDLFAERALEFVERHQEQPFLLFLNPTLPHAPHAIPSQHPYQHEPWTDGAKGHAAQITLLDRQIGLLVDRLRELGLEQNTVLLFAGDNGPHEEGGAGYDPDFFDANGALRGYKRNLYEGGIRVPVLAWSPGLLARSAGTVSAHPWSFVDVFPTLADLAGAPVPDDLDGRSVRTLLTGGSAPPVRPIYVNRRDRGGFPYANQADEGRLDRLCEAVRDGDWKLIRFAPGRDRYVPDDRWEVELYDLANDIGETTNVAASHPDVTAELTAFLRSAWTEPPTPRPTWSPNGLAIDPTPFLVAGQPNRVTTTFTNHETFTYAEVRLTLTAPDGWSVVAESPVDFPSIAAGARVTTIWAVAPAVDGTTNALTAGAEFIRNGEPVGADLTALPTLAAPAPTAASYLSDLPWILASNGYGPVELDMSNGEDAAGDGAPISIRGRRYDKGLGVHGESIVRYHLGGACERFISQIGLDDWSADRGDTGSVTFYVFADGEQRYRSNVLTRQDQPVSVDLSMTGVQVLTLVVTNASGTSLDHASWAAARVTVPG